MTVAIKKINNQNEPSSFGLQTKSQKTTPQKFIEVCVETGEVLTEIVESNGVIM